MYVCVCEREREKERVCLCVCVCCGKGPKGRTKVLEDSGKQLNSVSIKIEVGQYAPPEHSNSGNVSLRLNYMHICMYSP